jgi:uncharacterized protein YndB with AHSA1/START domain
MIATLQKGPKGITANFERHFKHSVQEVWAYLTTNGLLSQWFSELQVEDLRMGGLITFDMQDGTYARMEITDYEPASVLEYTWGEDQVRFELSTEPEGCRLLLIETLSEITAHTPKDLSGWHVCLDVIGALLNGETLEDLHKVWEQRYTEYKTLVESFRSS